MMHSSRVDGISCMQSPSFSTSVCVRSQHGTPTSDLSENKLQEKISPTMSTAVVNNYGSTFSLSENLFPRNQLEKSFVPSDFCNTVFVAKSGTSTCGKNNLSETSTFPDSLERAANSTDINASCSDNFESQCSNKVVLNKLFEMQVKDCPSQGENSLADVIPRDIDESHVISNRSEQLSNGEKENTLNAASVTVDTAVNNSNCASDEGPEGPNQDTYDHNSWILYGDSKLSVKNSWVLYGSSHSPSTQGSKPETELAVKDDGLSVGTGANNFDENVTDSGLDKMMKDKESTYEELFKESRPYVCSVCCKRFKLSHHLKEHMRIHTGEKPFPCPMCGERFSRSHLLRAHQARHAQESFPAVGTIFPCSKCMKIFESPQHLARHEKNHIQLNTHKCDVCDKQFGHPDLLKKHKLQHTLNSEDTDKCQLNSCMDLRIKQEPDDKDSPNLIVDSTDNRDLQDFRKRCTSSNSECNIPTKENKPLENNVLGEDNKLRSSEKKSSVSEEKTLYDQSSWVLYGDANKESVCATMKERQMDNPQNSDGAMSASLYKGIDMNKLHELYMATNRSLFNRNGMMSPFYNMFEFNRHALMSLIDQTVVNSGSLPPPYTRKQNANTESSFANRSRPHQCPHCSKRFKLSHHLREHLRIHTGEKPYHCDVCHERFSRSHLLQRHKTKHIADLTFHQVTDWIQKTSASSCDGNPNSYNEITDHFFTPHQEHQNLANQTDVNTCMEEPTTVNSSSVNKQNNVQNHISRSTDHRVGENYDDDLNYTKSNSRSEKASRDLANGDDEQSEDNNCTEPILHSVQTNHCTNKTSDEAGGVVPGIDYKSNMFVEISGLESASDSVDDMSRKVRKSHSDLGNSGTFQKTSSVNGISESGHRSSSVAGPENVDVNSISIKRSESKSDIFNVSKTNLKSSSTVGCSSMGSRFEGLPGKDCLSDCVDGVSEKGTNIQEDRSDNDSCTDGTASHAHQSKQRGECSNQKNVNESICENNNDKPSKTYFNAVPTTSEDESSVHTAPLKSHSRSSLATVQGESSSSEPPLTNYSSSFPLNQSLSSNNLNLFNTGYLNYTHNLQQAMSSAAFKSYHGDSLALDIPAPDFLQESFPSPLEFSSLFRSRRSGFMNCEFCGKWFADMNNLRQHMVSHSMDRHYSCHMCEKKFKRPHHLKEHMRIHTGEKPYVCDICEEKFSRSHILQRHRMKHSISLPSDLYAQNDVYRICEQTRARSPEFVYDKLCSSNVIKSEPDAELSPSLGSDSNSDKKPVHEVAMSENQLDLADSDSGNFKTNVSVEIKDYSQDFKSALLTFVCRECGKKFANSSNLKQHMVSHFPERLFSCSVCNKKFKRSHHLKEHSRTHTGEKPYQCKRCGECFQRSHLLMKHKEKHHSRCGYSMHYSPGADLSTVTHNDYLSDEKLQHETTELPNADDTTDISDLSESHKVADTDPDVQKAIDSDRGDHSGGEAVSCDICNKEFSSETLLTVHKRTHPGDRPHQCASCGKHFVLKYLLEVHEKSCI